jgi:DNA-binding NarL/FixJ family response regulator
MNKSILIIDDQESQARELCDALEKALDDCSICYASEERDIMMKIITRYYSVAIVDLRMEGYDMDGFTVMDQIMIANPYARIIIVSAYMSEYISRISEYISKGAVLAISEKKSLETWVPELAKIIKDYFTKDLNSFAIQILEDLYANAKNEPDATKKGRMFEEFVVGLFRQMGFIHIETRVRDRANNEIDLIVRNDLNDPFFGKFGRYLFVECKNRPELGFSKNDFIVFNKKVSSSNGDSNLGVVFTTGHIKRSVYLEALRESEKGIKILYLGSREIMKLIHTPNMLDEFKEIIDQQVA